MTLYFLRHGDAEEVWRDDVSRPLTEQGEEQARKAGATLYKLHAKIDFVLASPLERAKQMADIVTKQIGITGYTTSDYLVPGSNSRHLIQHINELKKESILMVGHEPQLRSFISLLVTGNTNMGIFIRKGALICLDCPAPLSPAHGALTWMMQQEEMEL